MIISPIDIAESDKPLISIIVAIYNTGRFLPDCLHSVITQSYAQWQLILVDDGSTDDSPAICDNYAAKDSRITVVHKPNTGKADSCNQAIKIAKGEYVTFLDSDDWIDEHYLEVLINAVLTTGADCASCGYLNEYVNETVAESVTGQQQVLGMSDAIALFYGRRLNSYLPGRLFLSSLLQEPIPQLKRHEDHAVLYKWLSHGQRMVFCPENLYHYRQRRNSAMNSGKQHDGLVAIMQESYCFIAERHILEDSENKRIAVTQLVRTAKSIARNLSYSEAKDTLRGIRDFLAGIKPISSGIVDGKTFCRLQILLGSPKFFWAFMRFWGLFVRGHREHAHQLYD